MTSVQVAAALAVLVGLEPHSDAFAAAFYEMNKPTIALWLSVMASAAVESMAPRHKGNCMADCYAGDCPVCMTPLGLASTAMCN